MVSHTGIEPVTPWLKVKCSTDWANDSHFGAGNEVRTRDIQLGRRTLYQLSYSRTSLYLFCLLWLRRLDLNQRPSGYEPDELPGCSTPRYLNGASGRTRTGTGLLPQDFKSCVSTISPPRLTYRDNIYIIIFSIFCQEKILVPKKGFEPSTLRVWTACSSQLSYLGTLTITILS